MGQTSVAIASVRGFTGSGRWSDENERRDERKGPDVDPAERKPSTLASPRAIIHARRPLREFPRPRADPSTPSASHCAPRRHKAQSEIRVSADNYGYVGPGQTVYSVANGAGTTYSAIGPDGSRLAVTTGSAFGWVGFDLHGSLASLAAQAATTISDAYRYNGFGETLAVYPSSGAAINPWRYQDRLDLSPDAANPLYDFGARLYRPELGAFTSLDTYAGSVIDPLSMNRYLYAQANPTSLVDPTGHASYQPGQICPYGPEDCGQVDWTPQSYSTGGSSTATSEAPTSSTGPVPIDPWSPPTWDEFTALLADGDAFRAYVLINGPAIFAWLYGEETGASPPSASAIAVAYMADAFVLYSDWEGYNLEGGVALDEFWSRDQLYQATGAGDPQVAALVWAWGLAGEIGISDPPAAGSTTIGGQSSRGLKTPGSGGGTHVPGRGGGSVWAQNHFQRGRDIEATLLQGYQGNRITSLNYPVIDAFAHGKATSIKSMDLTLPSYSGQPKYAEARLKGFVDAVADWSGFKPWGGTGRIPGSSVTSREVVVAIPVGTRNQFATEISNAIGYGAANGVAVRIVEVR